MLSQVFHVTMNCFIGPIMEKESPAEYWIELHWCGFESKFRFPLGWDWDEYRCKMKFHSFRRKQKKATHFCVLLQPCSESYGGDRAFSGFESTYIARYLIENRKRLVSFVDLHSYGKYIFYPYGYRKWVVDLTRLLLIVSFHF